MLVDSFGRIHDYLRISLTDHCNFRCSYCMPEGCIQFTHPNALMSKNEIIEISKTFVDLGVKKIRLTGGEPLLRKDFKEILGDLSELPVELAITTNGVLLDGFLPSLKNAGLKSINISLDSLDRNKFQQITKRNDFNRVMNNIILSSKLDFKVKINVVVMKGLNDHEINYFVDLTNRLPVHVRFIEFMPFAGNKWKKSQVMPSSRIVEEVGIVFPIEKLTDHKNSTSKAYKVTNYKGTFGVITTITDSFCNTCNRLRITADGKLRNCLFNSEETDLILPLREGRNIVELIEKSVRGKAKERGGYEYFPAEGKSRLDNSGRSMTELGG